MSLKFELEVPNLSSDIAFIFNAKNLPAPMTEKNVIKKGLRANKSLQEGGA